MPLARNSGELRYLLMSVLFTSGMNDAVGLAHTEGLEHLSVCDHGIPTDLGLVFSGFK